MTSPWISLAPVAATREATALAESGSLPAPATVAYGEPSLRDLYRDLYGVEGV